MDPEHAPTSLGPPAGSEPCIRRALPAEAAHLTALTLRSKAHWGYDEAFMAACVPTLTLTSDRLAEPGRHFFVVEDADGTVVGYAALRPDGPDSPDGELTHLFVEPHAIGHGYGHRLWQHTLAAARSLGVRRIRIEADPFAERFYVRQGAVRVGEIPSDAIPGRLLPLLRVDLD